MASTTSIPIVLQIPERARCLMVLAHGAGAGMAHPFMETLAGALVNHRIGVLRFNFPYMDAGKKTPDKPATLIERIEKAISLALEKAGGLPLIGGGKSMGGCMLSTAAAQGKADAVKGIVFFGFPLHAPGSTPSLTRAGHLKEVRQKLLFMQGTRDKLAEISMMKNLVSGLGTNATLHILEGADHGFATPKSTGKSLDDTILEMASRADHWISDTFSI